MGYSARWPGWRCTLWMGFTPLPLPSPHPEEVVGLELYQHSTDPGEDHNLVAGALGEEARGALTSCLTHIKEGFLDPLGINSTVEGMVGEVERLMN